MAAIARPGVCENRNRPMNKKLSTPAASVAAGKVPAPVRVKLRRKNSELAKPRDELECALVIQMACTHSAAMAVLNRLGGAAGGQTVAAMASAAARLLRAYATQVEALRRLGTAALS